MRSNTLPPYSSSFIFLLFLLAPVLIVAHASSPSSLTHQNNIRQIARHSYLLPDVTGLHLSPSRDPACPSLMLCVPGFMAECAYFRTRTLFAGMVMCNTLYFFLPIGRGSNLMLSTL